MNFLKSFAIWTNCIWFPVLFLMLRSRKLVADDLQLLFVLSLIGFIGAGVLWFPKLRLNSVGRAISAGICLGLVIPISGGFLWATIFSSFESAGLFAGGLMISIPSAIGGCIAGWLRSRVGQAGS